MSKVLSTGFLTSFIKPEALTLRDMFGTSYYLRNVRPKATWNIVFLRKKACIPEN